MSEKIGSNFPFFVISDEHFWPNGVFNWPSSTPSPSSSSSPSSALFLTLPQKLVNHQFKNSLRCVHIRLGKIGAAADHDHKEAATRPPLRVPTIKKAWDRGHLNKNTKIWTKKASGKSQLAKGGKEGAHTPHTGPLQRGQSRQQRRWHIAIEWWLFKGLPSIATPAN